MVLSFNLLRHCITDIDECALFNNGGCEQICINNPTSYTCACKPGFQLYNKYKCRGRYAYIDFVLSIVLIESVELLPKIQFLYEKFSYI